MPKNRSMILKEMKREDVLKLLEGQVNIIKPAVEAHIAYFSKLSCIRCGSDVYPIVNSRQLFKPNSVLPNYLAKCKACETEFEPYTRIEVTGPKAL